MPYQEILSRAWQIFKRQRALWLFGFLSACTGGVYGRLSLPTFNLQWPVPWQQQTPTGFAVPRGQIWAQHFQDFIEHVPAETWLLLILGASAAFLIWLIISLIVRSITDPALLRGALADAEGTPRLSVHSLFSQAQPFFGRVLAFYLLFGGGAAALAFTIGIIFLFITIVTLGIGILCILPLLLMFIPATWLLELYIEMVLLALVIEDLPLMEAVPRGWEIFKTHFWHLVLMGLILTAIHIGAGLLVGIVGGAAAIGTGFMLLTLGTGNHATGIILWALFGLAGVVILILILFSIFIAGLMQTYFQSAWTLAYLHFTKKWPREKTPNGNPVAP